MPIDIGGITEARQKRAMEEEGWMLQKERDKYSNVVFMEVHRRDAWRAQWREGGFVFHAREYPGILEEALVPTLLPATPFQPHF